MPRLLKYVPTIGDTERNWTVISELFKHEDNRQYVLIQHECGHVIEIKPSDFKAKRIPRCEMCSPEKRRKVAIDDRFSRLLVVDSERDEKGLLWWVCLCDCGTIDRAKGTDLIGGKKKFCIECYAAGRCTVDSLSFYLRRVEDKAAIREIPFALTEAYVRKLIEDQQYLCALSGVPIWFAATTPEHTHGGTTASLDRIDSGGGYTEGNVQFIHKDLNTMKMDLSQEQFIQMCNNVAAFNPLPEDVRIGYEFECRRPNHSEDAALLNRHRLR